MEYILPVVSARPKNELPKDSLLSELQMKPSEIPIYDNEIYKYEYFKRDKTKLEEAVATIRTELESVVTATKQTQERVKYIYETGKAHTLTSIDYIKDKENVAARAAGIGIGGLAGLLIASRKGVFKKLLYTSVGSGGIASLCYPNYAFQLSNELYANAKDYSVIGYNFIIGAKPQPKDESLKGSSPPSPPPPTSDLKMSSSEEAPSAEKKVDTKSDDQNSEKIEKSTKPQIPQDFGQSNPEDKDMYTTRGS